MKIIYMDCPVCKCVTYARVTLIGIYYILVRCKCGHEYRFDRDEVNIIEME